MTAPNAHETPVKRFAREFGAEPDGVWRAPGRVNVIGEHTDYNAGFVLPIAIPHGVTAAASRRSDDVLAVASAQFDGPAAQMRLDALEPSNASWHDHAAGVLWALRKGGHPVAGLSLLLDGDVPVGAGLSSSHALECAVALAANDLYSLGLSRDELARVTQRAENDYLGAPTGILDQSASLNCTAGHALFMDTADLSSRQVPFDLAAHSLELLVIDTRSPHRHSDGEYAARRAQCESAAAALGVDFLRTVTDPVVAAARLRAIVSDADDAELLIRRMRHVVTENARVQDVVALLESGADPRTIGPALTASHRSLQYDYEVTVPRLDTAVDAALSAGAHGARMTGGGFGGSVIALVDQAARAGIVTAVAEAFDGHEFARPEFFAVTAGPGASRLFLR
ncbi:galactokinase [Spelaeicoccus albus]|uniref:Galactokinase n=1 Tax=Spelaeicoccus albus TaxID=1280376 RepID=A0A7Z0D1F3_9MICO|nr:galactokinase [Spelaeicoccus albus]NYI66162.1 galactokinase [Spelaeicoccus albus]